MEKPKRSHRLQSESSDDEEDFESADEGEGSEQLSRSPSLPATSADDHKNSTSKNQVSKDRTAEKSCEMAAPEPSFTLRSAETEDVEKSDGDSAKAREFLQKKDIDERVFGTSADLEDQSSCSDIKPSGDESVQKDVSDDEEIQFKKNSTKEIENNSELEDTLIDETSVPTKESMDGQDNDGNVKGNIENQKESSIGRTADVPLEKLKDTLQDESLSSVADALKIDKDLEKPAEALAAESTKPAAPEEEGNTGSQSEGWGWGGWGTMLSSVSSGLSSVIETVETSLGIPEPEVIAKQVAEDEKQAEEMKATKVIETEPTKDSSPEVATPETNEALKGEEDGSYFTGFGVRGLSDVVSEGLGALEYLGKKTMDVISEGDPGLRNKREFLVPKEATLSQILREAKEEAEYKASHPDHKEPAVNFSTEFDKFQGLAHLEALEILSKESLSKVEEHIIDLSSNDLKSVKPLLRTIQEVVRFTEDEEENDDEDEDQDFESEVSECLKDINLSHVPNKTNEVDKRVKVWINACVAAQNETPLCKDRTEIFTTGISALAELTATTIEQFHKIAEVLLLLAENTDTSALVRAQSLKKLTLCVCKEVSILSTKFASCLSAVAKESQDPEAIESLITTLYVESNDSSRYLQHALKLLCPVLQHSSLSENTSIEKS